MSDEEDSVRLNFSDEDDSDSDGDSDMSDSPLDESLTEMAKKSKQYFWQYNVQAKGPKGTRLKLNIGDTDPHHPSNFEDPVFDASSTSLVGIRHGGKARKGDGNEVTPNPRKLFQIGKQLYKLNRQINGFQVSNDLPASIRNKSRKEKNKLASRACRLKKKAQHEANKVKLTGLGCEQSKFFFSSSCGCQFLKIFFNATRRGPHVKQQLGQEICKCFPFQALYGGSVSVYVAEYTFLL